MAFLAQDGERRFFCYANTDLRKEQQNDEIVAFAKYWKKRTGTFPGELIFDSKLTTQEKLDWLNRQGIQFITLRRRGAKLLGDLQSHPSSAWRRIELSCRSRHIDFLKWHATHQITAPRKSGTQAAGSGTVENRVIPKFLLEDIEIV